MILEQAKVMGLEMLRNGPLRFFPAEGNDLTLIGVGYAVAKGWAVYSGNGVFEINIAGKAALAELTSPHVGE